MVVVAQTMERGFLALILVLLTTSVNIFDYARIVKIEGIGVERVMLSVILLQRCLCTKVCVSDEAFNANLEKVRRLLPPPGQKWKSKLGYIQKVDRNLFKWVKRKVYGSRSVGSVGGERKKVEALGYTEKRGFFLS